MKIKDLNEHIVCCLCAGYFVDATTITECLHTFCKSCIVKYLQTSKYCPMCNIKIHETQPLLNLKLDRVMQDIVYKLVPGLQDSEEKRIREFYQSRGLDRVSQPSGEGMSLVVIWGRGGGASSNVFRAFLLPNFALWEEGSEPVPASPVSTFSQSRP